MAAVESTTAKLQSYMTPALTVPFGLNPAASHQRTAVARAVAGIGPRDPGSRGGGQGNGQPVLVLTPILADAPPVAAQPPVAPPPADPQLQQLQSRLQQQREALSAARARFAEEQGKSAELMPNAAAGEHVASPLKAAYDEAQAAAQKAQAQVGARQGERDAAASAAQQAHAALDEAHRAMDVAHTHKKKKNRRRAQAEAQQQIDVAQQQLAQARQTLGAAEQALAQAQAAAAPLLQAAQEAQAKWQPAGQALEQARGQLQAQMQALQQAAQAEQSARSELQITERLLFDRLPAASASGQAPALDPALRQTVSVVLDDKQQALLDAHAQVLRMEQELGQVQAHVQQLRAQASALQDQAVERDLQVAQLKGGLEAAKVPQTLAQLKVEEGQRELEAARAKLQHANDRLAEGNRDHAAAGGHKNGARRQVAYDAANKKIDDAKALIAAAEAEVAAAQGRLDQAQAALAAPTQAVQAAEAKWQQAVAAATAAHEQADAQAQAAEQALAMEVGAHQNLAAAQAQVVQALQARVELLNQATAAGQTGAGAALQDAEHALNAARAMVARQEQALAAAQARSDEARELGKPLDEQAAAAELEANRLKGVFDAAQLRRTQAEETVAARQREYDGVLAELKQAQAEVDRARDAVRDANFIKDKGDRYRAQAVTAKALEQAQARLAEVQPRIEPARQALEQAKREAAPQIEAALQAQAKWQGALAVAQALRGQANGQAQAAEQAVKAELNAQAGVQAAQVHLLQLGQLGLVPSAGDAQALAELVRIREEALNEAVESLARREEQVQAARTGERRERDAATPLQSQTLGLGLTAQNLAADAAPAQQADQAAQNEVERSRAELQQAKAALRGHEQELIAAEERAFRADYIRKAKKKAREQAAAEEAVNKAEAAIAEAKKRLATAEDAYARGVRRAAPLHEDAQNNQLAAQAAAQGAATSASMLQAQQGWVGQATVRHQAADQSLALSQALVVQARQAHAQALAALAAATHDTSAAQLLADQAQASQAAAEQYTALVQDTRAATAQHYAQELQRDALAVQAAAPQILGQFLEGKAAAAAQAFYQAQGQVQVLQQDFEAATKHAADAAPVAEEARKAMFDKDQDVALRFALQRSGRWVSAESMMGRARQILTEHAAQQPAAAQPAVEVQPGGVAQIEAALPMPMAKAGASVNAQAVRQLAEELAQQENDRIVAEAAPDKLAFMQEWQAREMSRRKTIGKQLHLMDDMAQFKEHDEGLKAARAHSLDTAQTLKTLSRAAIDAGERVQDAVLRSGQLGEKVEAAQAQLAQATEIAALASAELAGHGATLVQAAQAEQAAQQRLGAGWLLQQQGDRQAAAALREQAERVQDAGLAKLLNDQAALAEARAEAPQAVIAQSQAAAQQAAVAIGNAQQGVQAWAELAQKMAAWAAGQQQTLAQVREQMQASIQQLEQFGEQSGQALQAMYVLNDWAKAVIDEHAQRDKDVRMLHERRIRQDAIDRNAKKRAFFAKIVQFLVVATAAAATWWCGGAGAIAAMGAMQTMLVVGAMAAYTTAIAQGINVLAGFQEKFDVKAVALSGLAAAATAGLFQPVSGVIGQVAGKLGPATEFVVKGLSGAAINAGVQGAAKLVGLQERFDWSQVAASGLVLAAKAAAAAQLKAHNFSTLGQGAGRVVAGGVTDFLSTLAFNGRSPDYFALLGHLDDALPQSSNAGSGGDAPQEAPAQQPRTGYAAVDRGDPATGFVQRPALASLDADAFDPPWRTVPAGDVAVVRAGSGAAAGFEPILVASADGLSTSTRFDTGPLGYIGAAATDASSPLNPIAGVAKILGEWDDAPPMDAPPGPRAAPTTPASAVADIRVPDIDLGLLDPVSGGRWRLFDTGPQVDGIAASDGALRSAMQDFARLFPNVKVEPGDTLTGLAQRHGVPASHIAMANRLDPTNLNRIKAGDWLAIPSPQASSDPGFTQAAKAYEPALAYANEQYQQARRAALQELPSRAVPQELPRNTDTILRLDRGSAAATPQQQRAAVAQAVVDEIMLTNRANRNLGFRQPIPEPESSGWFEDSGSVMLNRGKANHDINGRPINPAYPNQPPIPVGKPDVHSGVPEFVEPFLPHSDIKTIATAMSPARTLLGGLLDAADLVATRAVLNAAGSTRVEGLAHEDNLSVVTGADGKPRVEITAPTERIQKGARPAQGIVDGLRTMAEETVVTAKALPGAVKNTVASATLPVRTLLGGVLDSADLVATQAVLNATGSTRVEGLAHEGNLSVVTGADGKPRIEVTAPTEKIQQGVRLSQGIVDGLQALADNPQATVRKAVAQGIQNVALDMQAADALRAQGRLVEARQKELELLAGVASAAVPVGGALYGAGKLTSAVISHVPQPNLRPYLQGFNEAVMDTVLPGSLRAKRWPPPGVSTPFDPAIALPKPIPVLRTPGRLERTFTTAADALSTIRTGALGSGAVIGAASLASGNPINVYVNTAIPTHSYNAPKSHNITIGWGDDFQASAWLGVGNWRPPTLITKAIEALTGQKFDVVASLPYSRLQNGKLSVAESPHVEAAELGLGGRWGPTDGPAASLHTLLRPGNITTPFRLEPGGPLKGQLAGQVATSPVFFGVYLGAHLGPAASTMRMVELYGLANWLAPRSTFGDGKKHLFDPTREPGHDHRSLGTGTLNPAYGQPPLSSYAPDFVINPFGYDANATDWRSKSVAYAHGVADSINGNVLGVANLLRTAPYQFAQTHFPLVTAFAQPEVAKAFSEHTFGASDVVVGPLSNAAAHSKQVQDGIWQVLTHPEQIVRTLETNLIDNPLETAQDAYNYAKTGTDAATIAAPLLGGRMPSGGAFAATPSPALRPAGPRPSGPHDAPSGRTFDFVNEGGVWKLADDVAPPPAAGTPALSLADASLPPAARPGLLAPAGEPPRTPGPKALPEFQSRIDQGEGSSTGSVSAGIRFPFFSHDLTPHRPQHLGRGEPTERPDPVPRPEPSDQIQKIRNPDPSSQVLPFDRYRVTKTSDDKYWLVDPDGKQVAANGSYAFAQVDGAMYAGNTSHNNVARGADVDYAGEVRFNNGALVSWNNRSGRYQPPAELATNVTLLPQEKFFPHANRVRASFELYPDHYRQAGSSERVPVPVGTFYSADRYPYPVRFSLPDLLNLRRYGEWGKLAYGEPADPNAFSAYVKEGVFDSLYRQGKYINPDDPLSRTEYDHVNLRTLPSGDNYYFSFNPGSDRSAVRAQLVDAAITRFLRDGSAINQLNDTIESGTRPHAQLMSDVEHMPLQEALLRTDIGRVAVEHGFSNVELAYIDSETRNLSVTFTKWSNRPIRGHLSPKVDVSGQFIFPPEAPYSVSSLASLDYRIGEAHHLHAEIHRGELTLDVAAPGDPTRLGSGTDMVLSLMKRLADDGINVNRVRLHWLRGADSTNYNQYTKNLEKGMDPKEAVARTWSGQLFSQQLGFPVIGAPYRNELGDILVLLERANLPTAPRQSASETAVRPSTASARPPILPDDEDDAFAVRSDN